MAIRTNPGYAIPSSVDELLDRARYNCSIYHFASAYSREIYDEFSMYARDMSYGRPCFSFLMPSEGSMVGYVYVFASEELLEKFIQENKEFVELNKKTKERSFYEN